MFQIISLIAAFQSLFFGVLVIVKKNKSMFDKHISAWMIFLSVHIVIVSVSQNNTPHLSYLPYLSYILSGLHGFFLYLCTKSLIDNSFKDFKKDYCIIIAYLLVAIVGLVFYNSYPRETAITSRIFAFLMNALYIILAVRLFHHYKRFIQTNFSNIDKLSFNWMRFLAFGLIIILSGALILVFFHEYLSIQFSLYSLFAVVVLLFVNVLGFRGIKHSTIFNQIVVPYNQPQTNEHTSTEREKSYTNYGLKEDDAAFLSGQLKNYMESEKPYTNIDLTLKDLASALNTYPHYVTQVLNTVFNQNFYDFINTYRVDEAKKRLVDSHYKNLTILAIAYDCGFNSKSTFNRIFKQKTGFTPSEYRNR